MTANRLSVLSAAFREVPLTCGPLTLRPLTAGSLNILMETGNPLFTGGDPSESAQFQALFEFIWIHTAPENEVIEACGNPDLLHTQARKLSLSISFDDLTEFAAGFASLNQRMNAALVETVPERGVGKPSGETPPTGSPLSYTISEDAPIPSASTGFSGVSRFPEPSNTSTPPTTRTEPSHAGRSRIWEEQSPEEDEDYANPVIPLP